MTGFWRGTHAFGPAPRRTVASEQRDFHQWHNGRPLFSVWAIDIAHPEVDRRLATMREALDPLLLPGYERQAHVTLQICGFPAPALRRADDFTIDRLAQQLTELRRLRLKPFRLRIGGAFSFASAVCLSVNDDGGVLQNLREALQGSGPRHDDTPYLPHVTAGLYGGAWPLHEIEERLRPMAGCPDVELEIRSLDWMTYDSVRVGGSLRTWLRLDLAEGRVHGPTGPQWEEMFGRSVSMAFAQSEDDADNP